MNDQAYLTKDYYLPKPATVSEAQSQLVLANRVLANENIFDFLGHVSVRHPERRDVFFISRSCSPEQVTLDDLLEVDFDGRVITPTRERPYGERFIHAAIYHARKDVNCVIHAHPKELVVLSVVDMPFKMILHSSAIFHRGLPLYDDYDLTSPESHGMIVRTLEEATRVAQTLGTCTGMLMRGHGCCVVGESIPHAVQAAIVLRDNVAMQLAAQQFGPIKCIDPVEAEVVDRAISEPKQE